jgi:hypothetical protein
MHEPFAYKLTLHSSSLTYDALQQCSPLHEHELKNHLLKALSDPYLVLARSLKTVLGFKPFQGIILSKDCSIRSVAILMLHFLGVDAVELDIFPAFTADEGSKMKVSAILGREFVTVALWQKYLSEKMKPVG